MPRQARTWSRLLVAGVVATCLLAGCGPSEPSQRLVWSDEFDGSAGSAPDTHAWKAATGGDGWGNNELQCYTDSRGNSALDGHGHLVITALRDPGHTCDGGRRNDYTSARLTSQNLQSFMYGTLSVRAKMPTGAGIWPAFWALGRDHDTVGWPASGEIDVTEVVGSDGAVSHATLHGAKPDGSPYAITSQFHAAADLSADFHTYSVTWTPSGFTFAVDGSIFSTVTKATVQKSGTWAFDQPFYLLLNVAVGGNFPGPPSSSTTWPQQMVVDWVRVYQDG